jgi:hypothetical protein
MLKMKKFISVIFLGLIIVLPGNVAFGQSDDNEVVIVIEDSYPKAFRGYFNITDIGLLIGSPQNQNPAPFSFMTFNGAHITEQLAVSMGIGVEFPSGSYMPVVLDTRYYVRNTNFSPFLQLYGGYALALDDNYSQGYYYDVSTSSAMPYYYEKYEPYTARGGWLFNPGFGIRSLFGENFGVVFSVGYRVQRLYYSAGDDRRRITDFNRLSMKIGITFR